MHDFGKPWWGVAYVPCMTNLRALCAWVIRWHVTCILSLAEHRQGRRAPSNHVCAHSVISMWHVVCLQHLARACSEQSRLTTVLPINHVIQMPQCLSGFVNHDYLDWITTQGNGVEERRAGGVQWQYASLKYGYLMTPGGWGRCQKNTPLKGDQG